MQQTRPFEPCPCNHLHGGHSLLMACGCVHKGRCLVQAGTKTKLMEAAQILKFFLFLFYLSLLDMIHDGTQLQKCYQQSLQCKAKSKRAVHNCTSRRTVSHQKEQNTIFWYGFARQACRCGLSGCRAPVRPDLGCWRAANECVGQPPPHPWLGLILALLSSHMVLALLAKRVTSNSVWLAKARPECVIVILRSQSRVPLD